ncbi:glycosyltransferase family 2 protein [Stappia sp. BW2]|uniref:glycosyltransferase family 2 protein n=1 Tax=Stappia sp. BW2 TaxID=2592622 RepID=UPI0011DECD56|nr:glycosyltransferase family 2 protein [Stappia sp. BW2]TYC79827.1 glycosyltransferase family 2 protein [Stappia sp. BW2]
MDQARTSIVIPTYNRAHLLPKAIQTSLDQTVKCEVIVVDHGSSDDTPDVAKSFGEAITYIRRERDFGPHFCWLEGVLHASSEFVHLQYDDDWIEPTFVEACLQQFDAKTGFVFTAARVVREGTEQVLDIQFDEWLPTTGVYPVGMLEKKILSSLISPGAAVYRKQILIDTLYQGRLPLSEAEYHGVGPDCLVTLLSLLKYEKLGFVKEPLATFQAHPQSITIDAKSDPKKKQKINDAYKEVKRYYKELKLLKKIRRLKGLMKR